MEQILLDEKCIESVVYNVSDVLNITVEELLHGDRKKYRDERRIAIYLCRKYTDHIALATIAKYFSCPSGTFIVELLESVEREMQDNNSTLKSKIEKVEECITENIEDNYEETTVE